MKRFVFLMGLLTVLAAAPRSLWASPDSLKTRWVNGTKYQLHKVLPKESWTSVSRKYSVSIDELRRSNNGVEDLKIGQIILIPIPEKSAKPEKNEVVTAPPKSPASVYSYHTVRSGETLYGIAKKYGMTLDELKKLNGLKTTSVQSGQKLKVGKSATPVPTPPVPAIEQKATASEIPSNTTTSGVYENQVPVPSAERKPAPEALTAARVPLGPEHLLTTQKITEKGLAAWVPADELKSNKFYALHRSAPVGTIIKLTNCMNNNSVYVKVVGPLPDTGDNEKLIIKITESAAQRMGVLDQRFVADLEYGLEN